MQKTLIETFQELKESEEMKAKKSTKQVDGDEEMDSEEEEEAVAEEANKEDGEYIEEMDSEEEEDGSEEVAKAKKEAAMKESHDAIINALAEEKISKDLQNKIATIFEAAVSDRVSIFEESLMSAYKKEMELYESNLNTQIDSYLTLIAEEFVAENEIAIESNVKVQLAENLIAGMTKLFESNNLNVPEEKFVALEELAEENEKLKTSFNSIFENNVKLKSVNESLVKKAVLIEAAKDLTDTQKEKLTVLTEGIAFENEEDFKESCQTIISRFILTESKTPANSADELLIEDTKTEDKTSVKVDTKVGQYANFMKKRV